MPKKITTALFLILVVLAVGCTKRNPAAPNIMLPPTPTPTAAPSGNLTLIDECEHTSNTNALGGAWYSFDDSGNFGTSVVVPKPFAMTISPGAGANGSNGYAQITGYVTTTFINGFVGLGTGLVKAPAPVYNLGVYHGLILFVRGDGKKYRLQIKSTNVTDFDYFGCDIQTTPFWQQVTLPFDVSVFKQQGFGAVQDFATALAQATDLQWQTEGQPLASIDLELDSLYLYK